MTPHGEPSSAAPPDPKVPTSTIVGIAVASALVPLNSTMIAVALPRIADDFGVGTGRVGILVTLYLVAMLVGQPIAGRLADRVGARRLATVGLVGFGACSLAAMTAGTFPLLVTMRAAQAAFGAALMPSVQAMLRLAVPAAERGRAFGLLGAVIGAGAGLGPVIGGVLTAAFDWHAVFGANVPVVLLVLFVLRGVEQPPVAGHQVDTTSRESRDLGDRVLSPVLVAALATQALTTVAQYTLLLLTPIVLDERGWGSGAVGLALSALTLGAVVMSPAGGRWGDRYGRRRPATLGVLVAVIAVAASAVFGGAVASALLVVTLLVFGIGLGAATPSVMTAGVESAPEHRTGAAAGVLSTGRYVGSIIASVLLALLVADGGRGVGPMLVVCLAAMAMSLVATLRLPGEPRRSAGG